MSTIEEELEMAILALEFYAAREKWKMYGFSSGDDPGLVARKALGAIAASQRRRQSEAPYRTATRGDDD